MEPFIIEKMPKMLNFMRFQQVFVVIGGRSAYNRKELVETVTRWEEGCYEQQENSCSDFRGTVLRT